MKKRGLLILPVLINIINTITAYNGYGDFSISSILESIDSSTMILGLIFLIIFALLTFALGKFFKDSYGKPNKSVVGVISGAISLIVIYAINRSGMDFENFFYDLGFTEGFLSVFIPIAFIIGAILVIWKLSFSWFLIITGLFLILASALGWIYQLWFGYVFGALLILIGLYLLNRKKKRDLGLNGYTGGVSPGGSGPSPRDLYNQQRREYEKQLEYQRKLALAQKKAEDRERQRYQQQEFEQRQRNYKTEVERRAKNINKIREEKARRIAEMEKRRKEIEKERAREMIRQKRLIETREVQERRAVEMRRRRGF